MEHQVEITKRAKAELMLLEESVRDAFFDNFIQPILNGLTPPDELQGKYKPSWEMAFVDNPMKQAFVGAAKRYNIHHYHFGYRFYRDGQDPKYAGDVSEGILHTRIEHCDTMIRHVVLEVCLEHSSPFKYPFDRALDEVA